jgi:hypothetical protein
MSELVFEAVQEADGGYCAERLTENIFTQGDTWDGLRRNVVEAPAAFFFDRPRPDEFVFISSGTNAKRSQGHCDKLLPPCRPVGLIRPACLTSFIRADPAR